MFPPLVFGLLPMNCISNQYSNLNYLTSSGERRAVTPAGTKVFGGASNRSPSTSLKTPQSGFLEEAEAVPAESIRPERSRTAIIANTYSKH
ncbi:hypothetical protein CIL05_04935 [Virgibacillus profundi]|uniref:Uncharacterized protein n=1 Tax=Virgibacillus profundi TaxID=2024555 RepID=A0A2A2IGS8_9BACI|nr:hypothetical protein CIL05_04935 [Virgibacillus profundi]PXY54626.1 hypothetical protein CIT14_05020 [Virgibacillus profundi]